MPRTHVPHRMWNPQVPGFRIGSVPRSASMPDGFPHPIHLIPHPFRTGAQPPPDHERTPLPMLTIYGYRHGDRVRDRRNGSTGTVRFLDLTGEERASGRYAEVEVRWDGSFVPDELHLVRPHLERI